MIGTGSIKRSAVLAILLLAAGCSYVDKMSAGSPKATARSFTATLSGAQEVPPTDVTGVAVVNATLDPDGTLHWSLAYRNLTGAVTGAHFHGPAAAGSNAGVTVDIGAQGTASPMQGAAHLDPAQVADLVAGRWYVNIHTAANPNGEIRGQVMPAP